MTNPQVLQTVIKGAANAHTGLLWHGSVNEAKQLLAQQIAVLANVLMQL